MNRIIDWTQNIYGNILENNSNSSTNSSDATPQIVDLKWTFWVLVIVNFFLLLASVY